MELANKYKELLVELFEKDTNPQGFDASDLMINYSDEYELYTFLELLKAGEKIRRKNFFKVIDVKELGLTINEGGTVLENAAPFVTNISLDNSPKKELKFSDKIGVFKVSFSDGSFMYYAKWLSAEGIEKMKEGMYVANKDTWHKFLKSIQYEEKKLSKPKKGIFRIRQSQQGQLYYEKIKKLNETPVVHPSTQELTKDIEFFYNNVSLFTQRNQPGTRKVMLIGPPGTGKTSISMRVSSRYQKEKCVAFATDLQAVASHLHKCAKYNVSTLVILEDAESSLQNVDSSILNFLDGIDQPINKEGAYVIMTTNHPDRIEPRAIRVGRISKRIMFGTLKGKDALECAKLYFENILWNESTSKEEKNKIYKSLLKVVSNDEKGMTGAEIKTLSEATVAYSVGEVIENITVETVNKVKELITKEITDIIKMSEEEGLAKSYTSNFGFKGRNSGIDLSEFLDDDFDDLDISPMRY